MKLTPLGGNNNDGLFRDVNSQIIYFRKYREGKGEIFRSTKTKEITRARLKRQEFMEELWGDKPLKVKRLTVGEIWPLWFQGMKETKRPATAKSINAGWFNLGPYVQNMFIDEITPEWWLNIYIPAKRAEENQRKGIDNTKRKFFNEWKWLSMFLKWAETNGKTDPGYKRPKLINPDPPTEEGKVYSDEEIAKLMKHSTLRMTFCLIAGVEHFMRRSEIRCLEWDRVDMEKRTIRLRAQDTKTKKSRTFPFNQNLYDLLVEVKAEAQAMGFGTRFVVPSYAYPGKDIPMTMTEFRNMWEGCYRKAGLPKGSRFHWMRHTGLTKAFKRKEASPALICFFAGLSLDEAQKTYLHYTTDDLRGVENLVGSIVEGRGKFVENDRDANLYPSVRRI